MNDSLNAPTRVCVTGANGFIGAQIVKDLLEQGYRVRGTVRSTSDPKKSEHLTSLPGAGERLELVEAHLLETASFDAAVADCDFVIHTASPYVVDVENPQRDLVDPALKGTLNVLESAAQVPSIKRIVLTSSMAAVSDEFPDRPLTEADWNEKSSLSRNPYYYSKMLAEKAAWEFMEQRKPSFDLVAINPLLVIGPSLSPGLNTSNESLLRLLNGGFPAIIDLTWGLVDVRDIARAHVLALETPKASGRYVCMAEALSIAEIVELLRSNGYADYKLPKLRLDNAFGNALIKLYSYTQPKGEGTYIRTQVGRVPIVDTTKIRTDLGLSFRDVRKSVLDAVEDMKEWGHV
ncbi:MAG: SDR family oxidoreductase [Rubricoccaceae bacterium]|nr:SDR family oxidoreductase [Rubricoccaceae bacterium]